MIFAVAVFAPIVGSAIAGLFGRIIGDRAAQAVTILFMILAAVCGVTAWVHLVFQGAPFDVIPVATWIEAGRLHLDWALRYDTLSASMVAMVTFIATMIHIYSIGYMGHETRPVFRFFSYLSLFTFAMLMLVTADNLVQLFFGWEGVGLASYLLIGYWYDRPSANAAAIKAFVVNRIADLFFAVGIAMVYATFGSLSFSEIFAAIPAHADDLYHLIGTHHAYEVIALLLFIGAMGKSAQLGLHVWLPDAMEGPTPVSALIHAATMVTAGVFLMARMSPIMSMAPDVLAFVTVIGGSTALFAATIGCVQNDIKRVIAYSTCSQLGYMFIAAGVGAYPVSIFHLITHAFFKSLLFLSAGSVIHAMHDEQDMRRMGGLWRKIPITYAVMWIGSLALAGIIPFAGYYSKDAILEVAYGAHTASGFYGYLCGLLAALLTAFYSGRLLLMTFHGPVKGDHHVYDHAHESPPVMTGPLIGLAIGATIAGFMLRPWFIGDHWQEYWRNSVVLVAHSQIMERMEDLPGLIRYLPLATGFAGFALAWFLYSARPALPAQLAARFPAIYRFLLNKWYFDELYDFLFVRPYRRLARLLWQVGDVTIIDGMPNGIAGLTAGSSGQVVRLQTGSIAVYAFTMLIGVVLLVTVFLVFR